MRKEIDKVCQTERKLTIFFVRFDQKAYQLNFGEVGSYFTTIDTGAAMELITSHRPRPRVINDSAH